MNHTKLDTTYLERRRIVRLLDFLTREKLTNEQMERIGRRLQKSGRRAIAPLVRRLWREKSDEQLYRYTLMLDFFDSEAWLDQLVKLTLQRRDLEDESRIPLLDILQNYGVDISVPPFASFSLSGSSLTGFIDSCLKEGSAGMVQFMDRFLDTDEHLREQLITRLGENNSYQAEAAAFLGMLAHFEYAETAKLAVETLGRLRHGHSLSVLHSLKHLTVEGLEESVAKSIRRLGFVGINTPEALPDRLSSNAKPVLVQSGPPDCYGSRTVLCSWKQDDQDFTAVVMHINEQDGVRHALVLHFDNSQEHDSYLEEINAEEGLFPVEFPFVINIIRHAVKQSIDNDLYLPPDFYACRYLFGEEDLRPKAYTPSFPVKVMDGLFERLTSLLSGCEELLDETFFEGWLFTEPAVYDIAESAGNIDLGTCPQETQLLLSERFCNEVIEPQKNVLFRSLLITADFIRQLECSPDIIQRILAVTLSLSSTQLPLYLHPFIRRLAFDSIEMARQSLAEGFDPRTITIYDNDGEWE